MSTLPFLVLAACFILVSVSAYDPEEAKKELKDIIDYLEDKRKLYLLRMSPRAAGAFSTIEQRCDKTLNQQVLESEQKFVYNLLNDSIWLSFKIDEFKKDLGRFSKGTMTQKEIEALMKTVEESKTQYYETIDKQIAYDKEQIAKFELVAKTCKITS